MASLTYTTVWSLLLPPPAPAYSHGKALGPRASDQRIFFWSFMASDQFYTIIVLTVSGFILRNKIHVHQGIYFLFSTPHCSSNSHVSSIPKGIWGSAHYITLPLLNLVKSIKLLPPSIQWAERLHKNSLHWRKTDLFYCQSFFYPSASPTDLQALTPKLKDIYAGWGKISTQKCKTSVQGDILFTGQPSSSPSPCCDLSLSPFNLLPFFYISKLSPAPAPFHSPFIATSSPCSSIPPLILPKGNICIKWVKI